MKKVLMCALFVSGLCHGEIYRWTDGEGRVHFSDRPQLGAKERVVAPENKSYKKAGLQGGVFKAPGINKRFAHYDVYPGKAGGMLSALNDATPIVKGGVKYHGNTDWNVTWKFELGAKGGVCRILNVSAEVDVLYTMPRLGNVRELGEKVKGAFDGFYAALMAHEQRHGESGLLAARDIEKELLLTPFSSDCKVVEAAANRTAKGIIARYNLRDVEYDRRTRHGETEGVSALKI